MWHVRLFLWLSFVGFADGEKSYIDMVVEQLPEIAENLVTPVSTKLSFQRRPVCPCISVLLDASSFLLIPRCSHGLRNWIHHMRSLVYRIKPTQLNKIDKMVMINGEGDLGASKVTAEVARVMTQVPDVVESLTGVQLKGMLAGIES